MLIVLYCFFLGGFEGWRGSHSKRDSCTLKKSKTGATALVSLLSFSPSLLSLFLYLWGWCFVFLFFQNWTTIGIKNTHRDTYETPAMKPFFLLYSFLKVNFQFVSRFISLLIFFSVLIKSVTEKKRSQDRTRRGKIDLDATEATVTLDYRYK
jgi:hypothetical protein